MAETPAETRPETPAEGRAARGEEGGAPGEWYLSFDCASKSFAFALLHFRPPPAGVLGELRLAAAAAKRRAAAEAGPRLDRAAELLRACFHLAAGGAADLIPGKKSREVSTVERVRAVLAHLEGPVARALARAAPAGCPPGDDPRLNVAVEFQMGANVPARVVATALLTHYAKARVFMVGPSFKNKLWYACRPDLRHGLFLERYQSRYTANKNHSKRLYYDHVAPLFGHSAAEAIPLRLRADFADCVLQVLAFRAFGGDPENAQKAF
jgi:hypothetical protein